MVEGTLHKDDNVLYEDHSIVNLHNSHGLSHTHVTGNIHITRGVELELESETLESEFWPGVGVRVSLLKETPTPDPNCFIWTFV